MSQVDLKTVQQWMMMTLSTPAGLSDGLQRASLDLNLNAEEMIAWHGGADRMTRLSVYANSYLLRLVQCLEVDFPALRNLMGDELFHFFATAYIWSQPSRSTTLYDLGEGFADFLQTTQIGKKSTEDGDHSYLQLPIELAKLERTRTEVARSKGLEGEAAAPALAVDTFAIATMKMNAAPCLRLVRLAYPLVSFIKAIDKGESAPAIPQPQESLVAITRLHYRVSMYALQTWQFYFLQAVQEQAAYSLCIEEAAKHSGESQDYILAALMLWLPTAVEMGFLQLCREA